MSRIISFLKSLIGINRDDESFIGLSRFSTSSKELHDSVKPKKEHKAELTLSEMLRRS